MQARLKCATVGILAMLCVYGAGAQPVNEDRVVWIGGIRQFIHIEGKDSNLPVLLFLHGGPGGSVMSYHHKWDGELVENFLVIQWDQRETGKTLELNSSPRQLTVELFKADAIELVDSLLTRFHKDKMFVVGHSWGTVLGFHLAKTQPQKLYAFIAVGPMINQLESERISLRMMLDKARAHGNNELVKQLETIHVPFENGEQLYYHRKNLLELTGSKSIPDKNYVLDWSKRWLDVYNTAARDNLFESLPSLNCPIYFFAGRKDYQTNSAITEEYFQKVQTPEKELVWFEKSAHGVPTSEPIKFQEELIRVTQKTMKKK